MADAPKKGRLTLYEDLLSDETRAELKARDDQAQAQEAKKKKDASLMFKPSNLGKKSSNAAKSANKAPKPTFASMHKLSSSTSTISAPPTVAASSPDPQQLTSTPSQTLPQPQPSQKRGFSDWLANEEEEWIYDKRSNNASRNKKKKKKQNAQEAWSWEDTYDPRIPVSFLDYPRSEVQRDINAAWKERLYKAHDREMKRREKERREKERQERERQEREAKQRDQQRQSPAIPLAQPVTFIDALKAWFAEQFAPDGSMSHPPPSDYSAPYPQREISAGQPHRDISHASIAQSDPYAARVAMTNMAAMGQPPANPSPGLLPQPSPSPAPPSGIAADKAAKIAAQIAAMKAKALAATGGNNATPSSVPRSENQPSAPLSIPPPPPPPIPPPPPDEPQTQQTQSGVIAAAPTFNPEYAAWKARQEAAEASSELNAFGQAAGPEATGSNRPGKAGFGQRMLKHMGWEEGKGLGASGEGITTAIIAKADKRKKKSDAQGGGFATPANMGKIVGGKKPKTASKKDAYAADNAHGPISEVIKLDGMLANLDVDKEIQDNNILQEIGDEMGGFGKVERLFIWRDNVGGHNEVFVKFTSQLSALRAVKDMDGIEFAGNMVKARFWDAEKFEAGEYE